MKKNLVIGFIVGLIGAMAGIVLAVNLPTKYASHNSDMEGVVLYAYTATNALVPVLADASGSLLTNASN